MSQVSFPWTCIASGDGGALTVEILEHTTRILGNNSPTDSGLVYWTDTTPFPEFSNPSDDLLNATRPSDNVIRIASGVGLVQGWGYINDADVDFDLAGGAANTTDIIGLRRDVNAQTVRLFIGRGGSGTAYTPIQNSAVWEVPLWEVDSNSGSFDGLRDVRKVVSGTSRVKMYDIDLEGLYDTTIEFGAKMFTHLEIDFVGAIDYGSEIGAWYMAFRDETNPNFIWASEPTQLAGFPGDVYWSLTEHPIPNLDTNGANDQPHMYVNSKIPFYNSPGNLYRTPPVFYATEITKRSGTFYRTGQFGYVSETTTLPTDTCDPISQFTFRIWDDVNNVFITSGNTFAEGSRLVVYGIV